MKQLITFLSVIVLLSCSNDENAFTKPENAFDAGREFIDACLKGDFKKAHAYMLDDNVNIDHLEKLQLDYKRRDKEEKRSYKEASININSVEEINDTTTIINYQNSYDKIGRKVKVIRRDKEWWVDLKYTFNPNL